MNYQIIWEEPATNAAARFLKDDPEGLRELLAAVDRLAEEPRPPDSVPYGSPNLRRLRAERYRVVYEVADATVTVAVLHAGRTE
ncbi:type II toxin-antitoxin system RelE/ParE family toxin [Streptomyces sp. N2-109]|uniref:Type II toxin-antitoxin system RelE/ParE family toxin n=1 Tax=Streptomyces gossypii TaxID=2883101 RepID=A0ABT2K2S8_9ACTN|nr:type II toxin-antitoxin system RelE/ParE family toxin [Streptomyces gossypii]MCT2594467.1 type II toxin-antitoxin system RelE/ParE family toxin [Streptomyces gossypii]